MAGKVGGWRVHRSDAGLDFNLQHYIIEKNQRVVFHPLLRRRVAVMDFRENDGILELLSEDTLERSLSKSLLFLIPRPSVFW
jgi:hypothetical protein